MAGPLVLDDEELRALLMMLRVGATFVELLTKGAHAVEYALTPEGSAAIDRLKVKIDAAVTAATAPPPSSGVN